MSDALLDASPAAVPIQTVDEGALTATLGALGGQAVGLAEAEGFKAKGGQALKLPGPDGKLAHVLLGLGGQAKAETFRIAAGRLPAGDYRLESLPDGLDVTEVALAWGLGTYRYDRYKPSKEGPARLVLPEGARADEARAIVHACALARDMVNTPANDMGPLQIETIAREIAEQFGAQITVVTGDDLLDQNYPAIHAVGRAAVPHRAPRMIEIAWGDAGDPVVCIIGKGVVFDTGGLDIKPSSGMRLMKKDMGGAAHALAADLDQASGEAGDPLWRLPLWAGYDEAVDSDIADLKNDPDAWAQAGAMTAALFLKRFAPASGAWAHLDIFAWNPKGRPGFPSGAEAQAIRALLRVLRKRFA